MKEGDQPSIIIQIRSRKVPPIFDHEMDNSKTKTVNLTEFVFHKIINPNKF